MAVSGSVSQSTGLLIELKLYVKLMLRNIAHMLAVCMSTR